MDASNESMTITAGTAIVIGAGLGGLCAAAALVQRFERVLVLERDALPDGPGSRGGTPQDRHAHVLLLGGLQALESLFPGFEAELVAAGAAPIRIAGDMRLERPGYDPFPPRDFGCVSFAASRPLIESLLRERVRRHPRIEVHDRCRVEHLVASGDAKEVRGVRCRRTDVAETLDADLVVDASRRAAPTLSFLSSVGCAAPPVDTIVVHRGYCSVSFELPPDALPDWRMLLTFPQAPDSSRGALITPLQHGRWILGTSGQHGELPPQDTADLLPYLRGLRTRTAHDTLARAVDLGPAAHYRFTASERRHFEQVAGFPRGLLAIGDAVCTFNPVYGQGMSVAAQQACLLRELLRSPAAEDDRLDGLAQAFFERAQGLIDAPWAMAAVPDFAFAQTLGERPPDLPRQLAFGRAMTRLAAEDAAVHRLMVEVAHLLKPRSVYRETGLLARVEEMLARESA